MNKFNLLQEPKLFQGEKRLASFSPYFEGWYFKCSNSLFPIAFIVGINKTKTQANSFLQVITAKESFYFLYPLEDFSFTSDPFCITLKNSRFSEQGLHLDIQEKSLTLLGDITFHHSIALQKKLFSPNIMGPFSYLPFMECNHAILSLYSILSGYIHFNETLLDYTNSIGYIEKDWGSSFPSSYVWCQANNFSLSNTSLFVSVATIPFGFFQFKGFICCFLFEGKEYRFTTYDTSHLSLYDVTEKSLHIIFTKNATSLEIKASLIEENILLAPKAGNMDRKIKESIQSPIYVTLKKGTSTIFESSSLGGLELCLS